MKKGTVVGLAVLVIIAIIGFSMVGTYNDMVDKSEEVDNKFSTISVQLERRADLIPNLVSTVKGYMKHEEDIIDSVTKARENLVNAKTISDKAKANDELSSALNNLLVLVENYPKLEANTTFINLQDELAGTENRIAVARKDYNDAVSEYNKVTKKFPSNLLASMFNFEEKEYFEASDSANEVPNVSFDED